MSAIDEFDELIINRLGLIINMLEFDNSSNHSYIRKNRATRLFHLLLLQVMSLLMVQHGILLTVENIPGQLNVIADVISWKFDVSKSAEIRVSLVSAKRLFQANRAIADSSAITYGNVHRHWCRFCLDNVLPVDGLSKVPLTKMYEFYVAFLMDFIKVKPGCASSYVSHALHHIYTNNVIKSAVEMHTTPRVTRILQGFE
jgi:hypothetical protein